MRVVAGSAGGLTLQSPQSGARPTMDRVRGAIFSSLGDCVVGARVLDLFAGSGALGIEALSRGAASATFVESEVRAVDCIRRNLERTRLDGSVRRMEVFHFLRQREGEFDVTFADPPYAKSENDPDFAAQLLACRELREIVAPGGLFVLERSPSAAAPDSWKCLRRKRYGATEVLILQNTGC